MYNKAILVPGSCSGFSSECTMQSKKESKKVPSCNPLLPCPPRSLCKTVSVECLAVIFSKTLRNPLQQSFTFSPHDPYCSSDSVIAFCEAVHADCRGGLYHDHIKHLEFKRLDLEDAVMGKMAIAINCLTLCSVSCYGCRMSKGGIGILGELWHSNEFLQLKHFSVEECDNIPTEQAPKSLERSSCNFASIICKFSPEPSKDSGDVVPLLEHVSFRGTLLCSSSKMQLTMNLPALKRLLLLDLSGTGPWIGKTSFLLGQCINALTNLTSWRFDGVNLCETRANAPESQQLQVSDSHMLLLGLRMKPQSEFSPNLFQEDWTYLYDKNELFRSSITNLSLCHACSMPGAGSMALTSILNCFPNLQSVSLSFSLISYSFAPRVFNQVHVRCPKLRKADFSGCSGQGPPPNLFFDA